MDRQQLVDQIAAIDLQICQLRIRTISLERDMSVHRNRPVSDDDRQRHARYANEVRSLADQKRALRKQMSEI